MNIKVTLILFVCLAIGFIYLVYTQSKIGQTSLIDIEPLQSKKSAKTLVVLLHAFNNDSDSLEDIVNTIKNHHGEKNVDFLTPNLPIKPFSIASNARMVAELIKLIDDTWETKRQTGSEYKNILFVGHSYGALIARKLYVVANGEKSAPFEKELIKALTSLNIQNPRSHRIWVNKVSRIILLAGINRGWSISHQMSIPRAIVYQLGVGMGYVIELFTDKLPNVMSIKKGAPFITQLRLQWLAMENSSETNQVTTVQLLGSIDDLVSPDDNIDFATGRHFIYLEVPYSDHKNVIKMIDNNSIKHKARREKLEQALTITENVDPYFEQLKSSYLSDKKISDVIFVVHGIRDLGHWTKKIARRVLLKNHEFASQRNFAIETSTYGYFPMLSFLSPGARQSKVEWFMDKYTQAKARYPEADFHFVGHSHGTYLLAKAIEDYESVEFENVVFAGSVVKQKFEWEKYIPDRIKRVQNFVTTQDWVVAFFPKALQTLGIQDIGSAGHDGFSSALTLDEVDEPDRYIIGGHSAAIQENMWDAIAHFILTGEQSELDSNLLSGEQNGLVKFFGYFPPIVWLIIASVLGFFLSILLKLEISEWKKTAIIIIYLYSIWAIITRV